MSLLMDALKKAELAKRQGQVDGNATAESVQGGLTLEPVDGATSAAQPVAEAASAAGGKLPNLPSHLEELDAQFLAEAKQAAATRLKASPSPATPRDTAMELQPASEPANRASPAAQSRSAAEPSGPRQSAAQNVFAAKQAAKPASGKSFGIAVGVLSLAAVAGIGGYFWWQLQPKGMAVASRAPLASPAPAPIAAPAPIPAPAAAPVQGSAVPAGPVAAQANASALAAAAAVLPKDGDEDAAAKPSARAGRQPQPPAPASAEPESPIRVTRAPLKVNPALLRGYDAFNRGDLVSAQAEYERAQKADPRNTDVMHGLAAIALRQGRPDQAEALYRQIAEADPQDTVAMAALINARGQVDPGVAESRLKSMAATQPELAAPHFALGNLYARHARWAEAQQAYFRAFSVEPDNPDILYNLAISLEHLRQTKLAAQYYSQAIAAAQSRPAGFDKAQAAARLATLQP